MNDLNFLNKRVLVTGGSGFIGSHLVKKLQSYNAEVYLLDKAQNRDENPNYFECDITNKEEVSNIVQKINPDYVFHLAAFLGKDVKEFEDIQRIININFGGTNNLIKACNNLKVERFISIGTDAIYGFSKDLITENNLKNPGDWYARTKLFSTELLQFYSTRISTPITIVNPSIVYGTGQLGRMLIPTLLNNYNNNNNNNNSEPIILQTNNVRDFVHVKDLVNALILCAKTDTKTCEVFNIGSGKDTSLSTLIKTIQKITNNGLNVEFSDSFNENTQRRVLDNSKAKHILNWEPTISLEEGLKEIFNKL